MSAEEVATIIGKLTLEVKALERERALLAEKLKEIAYRAKRTSEELDVFNIAPGTRIFTQDSKVNSIIETVNAGFDKSDIVQTLTEFNNVSIRLSDTQARLNQVVG